VTTSGGKRRLRQVSKACVNFGQRVQCSVFECVIEPEQWVRLKDKLEGIINRDTDSLRYYYLGSNWKHKIEHIGAKPSTDPDEPLIV
jgi:CRISPR-associated protein Cas2